MKIGIDISQIVYQTGVSRYTVELVKHLLKMDEKNHYFLYAGSIRQKKLLKSFIAEVSTKKTSSQITNISPKMADIFWNRLNLFSPDSQSLDVFHASNWALPRTKAKLVTTIHDLTFLKYPKSHTKHSISAHTRHLKRAKKYADKIITDSNSTKKDLIDYGIDQSKITVIYPAPAKIFKPINSKSKIKAIKQNHNLKGPYILSVGTQEPRKNLPTLIKAFSRFKNKNLTLAIVGKFGWGEHVKKVDNVQLLGFVPDEDLVGLYSAAKAFVYPSIYEGFGFPILEAFSCNCPVITSNISSLPELGGNAAIYTNPKKEKDIYEAIKFVLNLGSESRKSLIQKGQVQAKKFSWEKTANQTLKVYQEVVNVNRN